MKNINLTRFFCWGIAFLIPSLLFAQQNWISLGPNGEVYVFSMGIAPSNSEVIYIDAGGSVMFKSTNYGADWTQLASTSVCGNISAILVDPSSPDIAYALEGKG